MAILFGQILNMSLTGSIIILCVMAARLALKKAPKIYSYALWAVVLFRLLCPVSLTAPVSVLEVTNPQTASSERVSYVAYDAVENVLVQSGDVAPRVQSEPISIKELEEKPKDTSPSVMEIISYVWLAGIAVMLVYSTIVYLRLRRSLIGAMPWRENVYLADHIQSPFVLGTIRPKIYLPSDTPENELRYIIAHERHHIRRCDHIIKLLAYAALCIHWFNPLVWVSFILAGKDMEMSCDEAVIKKLGEHIRADYSASLLRLATHKKIIAGTPLAFGEGDTKGRVMNMAKWKKPKVWVSILCVVLCIVIIAVCALNPEEEKSVEELTRITNEGPTSFGVSDLCFVLPGGITSEMREREDFTKEEMKMLLDGQETRSSHVTVFSIDGVDIGGVQDHILPEGTDLTDPLSWDEQLDLWEWEDETLAYSGGSSPYCDWELHFDSDVPAGTPVTVRRSHYLFLSSYGNRVYDMWFDMTAADPAIVQEILSSAYVSEESGGRGRYQLEAPETLRLGGFQITVPTGYGYIRTGDTKLELLIQDVWGRRTTLGGVEVYMTPDFAIESSENMVLWVKALGVTWDETKDSIAITDETEYGDLSLSVDDLHNGTTVVDTQHYFYIQGDTVYDLWFDELQIEKKAEKEVLDSITLWDFSNNANTQSVPTAASSIPPGYSIQIDQFPKGYTFEMDEYGNVLFMNTADIIGGLTSYAIPEGVYDPQDTSFHWLEDVGIPDYEDSSLRYSYMNFLGIGNEWSVEFTDDESTVDRYHTFYVIGDRVFDCWFDLLQVDPDIWMDIRDAVKIIDHTEPGETEALYKCHAVLEAVQSGSSHISLERRYDAGLSDYTQEYLQHHNGNHDEWLSIITVQIAGMAEKHANLYADGRYFSNMGKWSEEEILWTEMKTERNPLRPWLTTYQWNKETVAYMDTVPDGSGECVMLRIDEPFVTRAEETEEHYFVNFYFDSKGSFVKAEITVNPFLEDAYIQTESIVTLENLFVYKEINAEYQRAIS